jgi:hypothetical protein
MSIRPSSSSFALRHAPRSAVQNSSADPKLFIAVALFLVVLIANALVILAAAPSSTDPASFYVSTT